MGFYLYIGITSLYLKDTMAFFFFQDGKTHKISSGKWCKTQKLQTNRNFSLTENAVLWYAEYVGAVKKPPVFSMEERLW